MSLKDQILGIKAKVYEVIYKDPITDEAVDLGFRTHVRVLNGQQRLSLEKMLLDENNEENGLVLWVMWAVCDRDGVRLFDEKDKEAIGEMPADYLYAIRDMCMKINKLGAKKDEENSDEKKD